jgi:hypothetical protein
MRNLPVATVIAASAILAPLTVAANEDMKTPASADRSQDNKQDNKKVLTAHGGGLLNSDATPEQAKKTAEATNRQILQKQHKR